MFCNEVSALGRRWTVRSVPDAASTDPVTLRDGTLVPDEVVAIARGRGVQDVRAYLEPTLRDFMPNPSVLANMDAAADRFAKALVEGERIAILGDYDVDGATSTSQLRRYQMMLGVENPLYHIPARLTEGYGPNIPAIEALFEKGARLLVIADSGTGAITQIARAREIGMDVIVLDHHEPLGDGSVPDGLVVNPKMPPNDGAYGYLCTAGLAFLFLVAVNRSLRVSGAFSRSGFGPEPKIQSLLGLAALGTVADVVALRNMNRALVACGLPLMASNPGLKALFELCKADRRAQAEVDNKTKNHKDIEYNAYACGFILGPCINAAGRISDTRLGTELLCTDDPEEAKRLAAMLFGLNRERQKMQEAMVSHAIRTVTDRGPDDSVLVLYDETWHPGIIGLGASKVKDQFDRSAVVIGAGGKGSGRSVVGFNIGKAFLEAVESGIIIKGGGHDAAGGLTIDPARIDEFRAFMNEQSKGTQRPMTKVDLVSEVGAITASAVWNFERLAPFGMGNANPQVAFVGGAVTSCSPLPIKQKDPDGPPPAPKHIKGGLVTARGSVEFIMFNAMGTPLGDAMLGAVGHYVDIVGEVSVNEFRSKMTIQIKPADAMIGGPVTFIESIAA
jgi:single-stranded-DNA-specific exonuclease